MIEREIYTSEPNKYTAFTYKLKDNHNRIAIRKFIDNLIQNVIATILFCSEIKQMTLIEQ
jgi:hypothetical protein